MYCQTHQTPNDPSSNFTFYQQQSDHPLQIVQEAIAYQSTPNQEEPLAGSTYDQRKKKANPNQKESLKSPRNHTKAFAPQSMPTLPFPHTPKSKNIKMMYQQETHADQSEETDMNNYNQLTLKLQTALNKISSQTKRLNKSAGNANGLIRRFQQCQIKKRKEIDRKKQQLQKQIIKQIKNKPTIDKKSQQIIKDTGYQPIYTRFQKIVQGKKKKIQQLEIIKIKQEEQELALFIEEYNKHVKRPATLRTYEQYYNQMQRWKEKKLEENRQKIQAKQAQQLEGITFHPKINPKSQRLVSEAQSKQPRLPIDQRGLVKVKTEYEFTFSPQINQKKAVK